MAGALALAVAGIAHAADVVTTKDGRTLNGEVSRVDADGVFLKVGVGEVKVFNTDIARITIERPASYDAALAALQSGDFASAAAGLKPLVDRYAGLPVAWVQQAMLKLAEAHTGQRNFTAAKAMTDRFAQLYPQAQQSAGAGLQSARLLMGQKNFQGAAEAVRKFVEPILGNTAPSPAQETVAAEALLLLGDCQRALAQRSEALDSYLSVVTLFDVDAARTAEARHKAAQLFEEMQNWKRARGMYQELLQETPSAEFAGDATKRLAALNAAHPE
jgi:TolA-binding protein